MDTEDKIKTRVAGVDIGVKRTTYALVDVRGEIIARDHFRTTDYPEVNDYVQALADHLIELFEANGGYETVRSVGISAPSGNFLTGCMENAANMKWKGVVPLAAMLRDRLGLAVALANDAHIAALGERAYGSAHGMRDFVVCTISHGGLGSCFFSNGQPHLGTLGFAGEVGHTCVVEDGRPCGCGRKGCLESYSSARGLVMTIRELLEQGMHSDLLASKDLDALTASELEQYCDDGDEVAIEACRRTGVMLGLGLANYASMVNPEAIILTGDMTQLGNWLIKPLRQSFNEHVFHNIRGHVRILVSILKDGERDVLGASALAWDVKEYSLFK